MSGAAAPDLIRPSFEWAPESAGTELGREAVKLAASAGLMLDPWQQYTLDRVLAEDEGLRPAAFEAAVIVPRQNGKGAVLEALSLAWLFITEAPLILHSAHEFKTAAEAFRRLRMLLQDCPPLGRRVANITTGTGNEAIELKSGQRLRYVARSKGSGRGFTAGKLILDEAYALESEEMAALLPTLSTQPEAQLVYTSSAGMVNSTHLRAVRDRGRRGGDPSLCYLEWGGTAECPDDCLHVWNDPTCALNDRVLWRAANPGIGIRIPEEFIAKERRAMGSAEFARERLGVWDEPVGVGAVPLELWTECADEESKPLGRPVFAIDASPGGKSAAIVAAITRPDGLPHLEIVSHARGTDWVPAKAAELTSHGPLDWVLDPAGPAGALLPDLLMAGIEPRQTAARDLGQACEAFATAVSDHRLRHLGDPVLARSIAAAGRRDIGDGLWAWSRRRSEADICPLVAATLAHWGLSVVPPVPPPAPPPKMTRRPARSETSDLATAGF